MTTTAMRFGRFASSVVACIALFGAAPLLLVAAARRRFGGPSPLAGVPRVTTWELDVVGAAIRDPLSDDVVIDVIVRSCLVIAWAGLIVIAVTTVLEAFHVARHRGMSMPAVRGLGWAQPIARAVVAGLLVVAPISTTRASLASALAGLDPEVRAPVHAAPPVDDPIDTRPHDPNGPSSGPDRRATVADRRHVVQRGESVYSIASAIAATSALTTTEIADAILDVNLGTVMPGGQCFTSPAYIEVGWELTIPASVLGHDDRPTITSPARRVGDGPTHLVTQGESLSSIAAAQFGEADRWPEIWALNAGATMADGRTFDDPDLILPGWELTLPGADSSTSAGVPEATDVEPGARVPEQVQVERDDRPDGVVSETGAPSPGTAPGSDLPAEHRSPPAHDVDDHPVRSSVDRPASSAPIDDSNVARAPASALAPAPAPAADERAETRRGASPAPAPLRVEHAAFFATGLLALVAARRRARHRRARAGARLPAPSPAQSDAERRLRIVGEGERASRIDVAVRAAAHALVGSGAQIGIVLVGGDGALELVLTRRALLPVPWTFDGSSDGRHWVLPADVPIEDLTDAARQVGAPCVAVVQLGRSGERDVLVDVEALGTLAIDDPSGAVVRAIAAGLASSPHAETAHLIGVALPNATMLGHRNAHDVESVGGAVELAADLVGATMRAERSTFELRSLQTGGEAWEPAVILLAPTVEIEELDPTLPAGGHGLAVVGPAQLGDRATARLAPTGGEWRLHAFGTDLAVHPVGLSLDELDDVAGLVASASELAPADEAAADRPVMRIPTDGTASVRKTSADPDRDAAAVDVHDDIAIIVRLMGEVEIVDVAGSVGAFERSKAVELIAWLATHRERSTRAGARTALWELDVRDATFANVVSEARRGLARLVPPPEGEEWLARTLTEQLPLHRAVVTDAELIERRLGIARHQSTHDAIETLRPAVEMVRDLPFAGTGYLWPDADGITSSLVLLSTTVTSELAHHALHVGDTELVFWATGRGLAVLPGHEELIGMRMRAHAQTGDLAGVRSEWASYERVLVADPWSDGEPAPKLVEIRRELLA